MFASNWTMNVRSVLVAILVGRSALACSQPPRTAHAPGVAPRESRVDERRLVAELEADGYHGARVERPAPPPAPDPNDMPALPLALLAAGHNDTDGLHVLFTGAPPPSVLRITIPGPVRLGPKLFLRAFAHRYAESLAFGIGGATFVESFPPGKVLLADSNPQRDAGCLYVLLRLERSAEANGSVVISRECQAADRSPPSYRSRDLPYTANGAVEVLARCGFSANGINEAYVGFALDKFGDVYDVALRPAERRRDLAWDYDPERPLAAVTNVLMRYVRTMPPAQVEQLMWDIAQAETGSRRKPDFVYGAPTCTAVIDSPPAPRTINLEEHGGSAAARSRASLLSALHE